MFSIGAKTWPGVSKVVEECGEVLQIVGKLVATGGRVRHWDPALDRLDIRLLEEMADVQAAIEFVMEANFSPKAWSRFNLRKLVKLDLFRKWHAEGDLLPSISPEEALEEARRN